jgi:hypothetical protein
VAVEVACHDVAESKPWRTYPNGPGRVEYRASLDGALGDLFPVGLVTGAAPKLTRVGRVGWRGSVGAAGPHLRDGVRLVPDEDTGQIDRDQWVDAIRDIELYRTRSGRRPFLRDDRPAPEVVAPAWAWRTCSTDPRGEGHSGDEAQDDHRRWSSPDG